MARSDIAFTKSPIPGSIMSAGNNGGYVRKSGEREREERKSGLFKEASGRSLVRGIARGSCRHQTRFFLGSFSRAKYDVYGSVSNCALGRVGLIAKKQTSLSVFFFFLLVSTLYLTMAGSIPSEFQAPNSQELSQGSILEFRRGLIQLLLLRSSLPIRSSAKRFNSKLNAGEDLVHCFSPGSKNRRKNSREFLCM